jgi:hypothetical protein
MRRSRTGQDKPLSRPDSRSGVPHDVDAKYGLEPIFEPGGADAADSTRGGTQPRSVQCPYCGECFETLVDLSAGSASYIEDCQVCCRPIEFRLDVDQTGALVGLGVLRTD